jgi:homoserine kinase type II
MAVYTTVSDEALEAFLGKYNLGEARSFKGIAEGVENSNYYLETDQGRFILTLFERRADPADLPYFIQLKQHLDTKGFPCPAPVASRDGVALQTLENKPALIVTFLDGLSPKRPTAQQCRSLGEGLARMHLALSDFPLTRDNTLGPASWPRLWKGRSETAESLQPGLAALINEDLAEIANARPQSRAMPRGTIHADLFPDNAFFLHDTFTGAIDFYFACTDALAYDIAVCLNSWAFEDGAEYNYSKGAALIAGYESVRPLEAVERDSLALLCRGAALRFFMTRLVDWTDTPADALVRPKNPLEYAAKLAFHRKAQTAADYGA